MKVLDPRISQGATVLAALVVLSMSWRFGYRPAVRQLEQSRVRVKTLTSQIAQVGALVQGAGGGEAWLAQNERRLAALIARFPPEDRVPQLLNALVDAFRSGDMKLLNVTQGNLEPMQRRDAPLLVGGAPCFRLPVTVTAEGRYQTVLAALERLTQDTFPAVVSVEDVDLRVRSEAGIILAATVRLYVYVTGASSRAEPHA